MAALGFCLATRDDAEELVALVNSAYRGESSREGWTYEADLLGGQRTDVEGLLEFIERSATTGECAMLVGRIDGVVNACVQLERKGEQAYLGMLSVRPSRQAQGLGRQVLTAAERYVSEQWQTTAIIMTVIVQRTELIEWYIRRGFVRTAERSPFPYGDIRFGEPKVENLEFVVMTKDLPF
jgi:ribosomal protein S18 acetylase RimI-like enzyme